ncbi:MAG: transporter, partial [Gammaproteobacteria bacterium]|nr:transporter [Gammaproteobacteria bacterium]
LMKDVITPQLVASWMGLNELTAREVVDMNLMLTLAAHLFITAGFFCSTTLFYSEEKDHYRLLREDFFTDLETPVIADEAQGGYDHQQRNKLGIMVMLMGAGILLMSLIPNPMWGRLLFVMCSLSILTIGFLLQRSTRTEARKSVSGT